MVAGSVRSEILEDASQRRLGHGDLKKIVAKWDLVAVSGCGGRKERKHCTMLSFAPDSPRNESGSSETPSYINPWGNID